MAIEAGIYSLLCSFSRLTAIVGTRITPVILPEWQARPAMTFTGVGGSSRPTFNSYGEDSKRVQFDFYADAENGTFDDATDARDILRTYLDGYSGLLSDGTYLQMAEHIQPLDQFNNDARNFRCAAEYYLHYCFNPSSGSGAISTLVLTDVVTSGPVSIFLANGQIMVATGGSSPGANPVLLDTVTGSPFTITVDAGQLEVSSGGSGGVASLQFQDSLTSTIYTVTVASGQLEVN